METHEGVDKPATSSELQAKPAKPILWLVLGMASVFIIGVGIGYYLLQNRVSPILKKSKPHPTVILIPSETSSKPTEIIKTNRASELIYIRNNNIYKYSLVDKKETPLTSDGGDFISYKQLAANVNQNFSVERCVRQDREGKQPYSCAIALYTSGTATPVELVKRSSKANVNGYHVGGEFGPFAVSRDGMLLVYVQTQEVDATKSAVEIHLRRLAAKNDEILTTISVGTGGRGGSLNDEVGIFFSPDQTKIILNLTTLYPQFGSEDQGTMFIFDLPTKKLIWKQANQWTTFGRFLSNQTVVAKQQPDNGDQASLVTIDVTSGAVTALGNFAGYAIMPLNKDMILYFRDQAESGQGMVLEQLDLTTNKKTIVKEGVIPMGSVVADSLAVRTMKPCDPECGMDLYNGYETDGVAVLNIENGTINPISFSSAVFDLSLR